MLAFAQRDIGERTAYLEWLFGGQQGESELHVIKVWRSCRIPSAAEIGSNYLWYHGQP
jgi:hypothetical protein